MITAIYLYVEQILLYAYGAYACFHQKVRFPFAQISGGIACLILSGSTVPSHYFPSYFCAVATTFFAMSGRISQRLLRSGALFLILAGMDELVELPRKYFFHADGTIGEPLLLLESLTAFLFFSLILLFQKKISGKRKKLLSALFARLAPGLLLLVILHMMVTVTYLEETYSYVPEESSRAIILFLNGSSLFIIWLLALLIFYIRETNLSLLEKEQQEEQLRAAQKDYYEVLLSNETATRKYRHDLNNHLLCLSHLCKNRDIAGLESYVKNMQEDFLSSQNPAFISDNEIISALTTHLLADLPPAVSVSYQESLKAPIAADSFCLCTIYSNLLKNAVEEVKRCPSSDNLQLNIRLQSGEKLFALEISNSVSTESVDLTRTQKASAKDHGFGLQNVREKVGQLEGSISFEQKDSLFFVRVLLPNDSPPSA